MIKVAVCKQYRQRLQFFCIDKIGKYVLFLFSYAARINQHTISFFIPKDMGIYFHLVKYKRVDKCFHNQLFLRITNWDNRTYFLFGRQPEDRRQFFTGNKWPGHVDGSKIKALSCQENQHGHTGN